MKLLDVDIAETQTISGFKYSGQKVESLSSDEYTIASIEVDGSGSTYGFVSDLEKMAKNIIESLSKSPRSNNMLVRVEAFDSSLKEVHGFVELSKVPPDYTNSLYMGGMTALYDATGVGVESVEAYAKDLKKFDFISNGIVFVITDGGENASSNYRSSKKVKDLIDKVRSNETMESIKLILVGIGNELSVKSILENYANEAGFDQFIWCGDATPQKLAKLAGFVSKSVSSQSQSLGTGGASQNLTF